MINNDNNLIKEFIEEDLVIDEHKYLWTKNILEVLEKVLKIHIKLHNMDGHIKNGNIFVFNHFSRLETFIPQYIFYKKENVFCRSIASSVFFKEEKTAKYLTGIGAVPSDFPNITDFMAREILKDLKIIVFPEGGMIKDKKVLDNLGRLSIYARELKARRKPHTGSAVIGIKAQRYKDLFLLSLKNKNWDLVDKYRNLFNPNMEMEVIYKKAQEPVLIIPVNITFYPLRITENIITKITNIFTKIKEKRLRDELLVETNILFNNTDMDITFGSPIPITKYLTRYDYKLTELIFKEEIIKSKKEKSITKPMLIEIVKHRTRNISVKIRDEYMENIYNFITVNPMHLASEILFQLLRDKNETKINKDDFTKLIYIGIKKIQNYNSMQLHRDMLLPERYNDILLGCNERIESFIKTACDENLIYLEGDNIVITKNLLSQSSFDEIRTKNIPQVLKNEIQPKFEVHDLINSILKINQENINDLLIDYLFDDENKIYQLANEKYNNELYNDLNIKEKDNIPGTPFFLKQLKKSKTAILLVHGFSASPPEMRYLGDILFNAGHTVLGIRLEGHGTSPYDLARFEWEDWFSSVERGYNLLSYYADKIIVIGFSMGGSLALHLASYNKNKLCGVVSISSPIIIRDTYGRYFFLLPIINKINNLTRSFTEKETGVIEFIPSDPENKKTNYKHMPLKGIYELMKLTNALRRELKNITCPLLILHASKDYEVDSESANIIYNESASTEKSLHFINTSNHVIVTPDYPEIYEKILNFLKRIS